MMMMMKVVAVVVVVVIAVAVIVMVIMVLMVVLVESYKPLFVYVCVCVCECAQVPCVVSTYASMYRVQDRVTGRLLLYSFKYMNYIFGCLCSRLLEVKAHKSLHN